MWLSPRRIQMLALRLAVGFFVMKTVNLMSFISWAGLRCYAPTGVPCLRKEAALIPRVWIL